MVYLDGEFEIYTPKAPSSPPTEPCKIRLVGILIENHSFLSRAMSTSTGMHGRVGPSASQQSCKTMKPLSSRSRRGPRGTHCAGGTQGAVTSHGPASLGGTPVTPCFACLPSSPSYISIFPATDGCRSTSLCLRSGSRLQPTFSFHFCRYYITLRRLGIITFVIQRGTSD